jgi:putative metallohydrolase (TIGR04338 family)
MVYNGENEVTRLLSLANRYRDPVREVELMGTVISLPLERKFASVESIQTYVERLLALPVIREAFPSFNGSVPTVQAAKRATKRACYYWGTIEIPMGFQGGSRWACREMIVLHELAHHMAPGDAHGARFRYAFVKLVEIAMAPEVGFALQVCWYQAGIQESVACA